jgi:hypothetical protein
MYLRARSHTGNQLTTQAQYLEQPNVRRKWIEGATVASNASFGGISGYAKTKAVERVKDIADEHDYQAQTTQNPVRRWWWDFLLASEDDTAALTGVLHVHVTQYVEFIHRVGVTDA